MKRNRCCFCGGIMGAFIKLHQGWVCIPCFKRLLRDDTRETGWNT